MDIRECRKAMRAMLEWLRRLTKALVFYLTARTALAMTLFAITKAAPAMARRTTGGVKRFARRLAFLSGGDNV